MKIGIYLGNNKGTPIDVSTIEKGNPGIGGTQYQMLLLAHFLSRHEYDVTVYASRDCIGGGIGIVL